MLGTPGTHRSRSASLSPRLELAGTRSKTASPSPACPTPCLAEAECLGMAAGRRVPSPWGCLGPTCRFTQRPHKVQLPPPSR